jgi:dipeptidase
MKAFSYKNIVIVLPACLFFSASIVTAQSDWPEGIPDECTTITVGKTATIDGSVITSHTDDSHGWILLRGRNMRRAQ